MAGSRAEPLQLSLINIRFFQDLYKTHWPEGGCKEILRTDNSAALPLFGRLIPL
jgi:hypothetical protein